MSDNDDDNKVPDTVVSPDTEDSLDQFQNDPGDEEVHEYEESYLENIVFQVVEENPEVKSTSCCFYLSEDDIPKKLGPFIDKINIEMDLSCLSNMITNLMNAINFVHQSADKNEKYHCIDLFFRFRHDFLHNLSMRAVNLEEKKTDDKFCDVFDFMDSVRSPDRIILIEKLVVIVESTATADVKKGFISKGKIEEGFKSKYEREIETLTNNGYTVEYFVIIFDMKDPINCSYQLELKKLTSLIGTNLNREYINKIEILRGIFCNLSSEISKKYSIELSNLLSERFDLQKPDLPNIDFLLTEGPSKNPRYDRVSVSTNVFSKINSVWFILPRILDHTNFNGEVSIVPCLDHSNNKFTFVKSKNGIGFDKMMDILSDGDKPGFSRLLIQTFEGRPITFERSDLEFFEKVDYTVPILEEKTKLYQVKHITSDELSKVSQIKDYSDYVSIEYYKNVHHIYEDEDYEDKLIDSLCDFYGKIDTNEDFEEKISEMNKKPFSSFELTKEVISKSVVDYNKKMFEMNDTNSNSGIIYYQKSPFLHACSDGRSLEYCDYKDQPVKALIIMGLMKKGPYTSEIYFRMKDKDFLWGSRKSGSNKIESELLGELKKVQSDLYKVQMNLRKEKGFGHLPKLKDIPGHKDLKDKLSEANNKLSKIRGPNKSRLSQVRLPTKKNSVFRKHFEEEMDHFKKKRSSKQFKGVGMIDDLILSVDFLNLKNAMLQPPLETCPDNFYFDHYSMDSPLLQKLKSDYLDNSRKNCSFLKNTSFYTSCSFVSRLCHSLAFYSQTAMGSDYCAVDNLGYGNVILLVKGGKKIFKTKKSKLFRILYPIHNEIVSWYKSPSYRSSCEIVSNEGQYYLLTPWHMLDEVILNDGLTFLHRTSSYLLLSHEQDIRKSFEKNFFNTLLAFHSKRKTEELLHNLRYVCVNSISNISRLDLMLPELAGFNYDYFQAFIRSSLSKNYEEFSTKLLVYNQEEKVGLDYFKRSELLSLFDRSSIENLEDLTVTIYSTFLMSKSPTNQILEQVNNLKTMLKTKKLHDLQSSDEVSEQYKINGVVLEDDITGYWNKLFESDFNFDPAYCNLTGKFAGDYMSNIISKGDANSKWMSIVNESWDDFANTKGLRGMDDDKFFNRKGYYIVYDEIIKNTEILKQIKDLLLSTEDDFSKRKKLNKLNKRYSQEMGCKNMKEAVFHVVDKKQRGGGREIFVMDLQTKINQQAIEKFLSYLCKKVPNEAISVPSNRRLQHIHANVFERFKKSDLISYNATLDCRKWAPHSVINKFIDFIMGMSDFLPDTFITHFLCFFSKMFTKKIFTRKGIKEVMISNSENSKLAKDYLIDDNLKKGAYFQMSYSWVMGIFNYMSSFMHVMNQMHASHIIRKVTSRCEVDIVYYHMNAHSDDSGGKIQAPSKLAMKKTFFIYELLLKASNHLLSDKKCNISLRYFEFLSVLYISNNLLSLISKFSGTFNFHPTDNGYCGDVNECYSKCIEMISLGATFEQAYLSMKISSHLVFKFYFNRDPTPSDCLLPPQLLGIPDGHPLIVLICGSETDVIRLTLNDPVKFNKFLFLSRIFNIGKDMNDDVIKPISVRPNIRASDELVDHKSKINVEDLSEDLLWVLKNINTKNTGLKLIKYGIMLNDPKFVAALIDETVTRRISRAYHFRSHDIVSTIWGLISYKTAKTCINYFIFNEVKDDLNDDLKSAINESMKDFEEQVDYFKNKYTTYELMNFEVYGFLKSTWDINYTKEDIVFSRKTCKPIHINMQKTGLPTAQNFDPAELCIWIKYPEYRWLISLADDYNNKFEQVKSYLERHGIDIENVETNWLYSFLQKLKTKFVKEYFIYSNMPSEIRDISNFQDFLCFLSHNSFKNKFIQGIMSPLGATVSQPITLLFRRVLDEEALRVITFVSYAFSLITNFELFKEVSDLNIDSSILGCKSTKMYDLVLELISIWELKGDYNSLVIPHLICMKEKMDNSLYSAPWLKDSYYYSFTKSQKLIGNVWLGKGNLFINTPRIKFDFSILNNKISHIFSNKKLLTLNNLEISFINSVLMNANLPKLEDHFSNVNYSKWDKLGLGLNNAGLFCIDICRNLKSAFVDFEFRMSSLHMASRPEICKVSIQKNFSYKFTYEDEIFGNKHFNINVLKVQPSEIYKILTSMYDNKENRIKIESRGEFFSRYLKMFIGDVVGAELRVTQRQFFDLMHSTRVYAILSDLVEADLLSAENFKSRKHVYPGQEGGLLSCLINFKNINEEFQFDYDVVLSSEMMALKSSQPDIFISNLVTNIKEKYNSLYTADYKDAIKADLTKIYNLINSERSSKNLLSLLTNWGYIGVMGSLEEMMFIKKAENYTGIRLYLKNNLFKKLNEDALSTLLEAFVKSAEQFNYFNDTDLIKNHLCCKSIKDFKKVLISYVHSNVLSSYKTDSRFTGMSTVEIFKISETLKILMISNDFNKCMEKHFEANLLLSLLPVENKNFSDIIIMLQTLTMSFSLNQNIKHKLDFIKPTQHDHDLIRPFTVTKELFNKTSFGFKISAALHHGFLSRERVKKFSSHHFKVFKGLLYDINMSLGEGGGSYLPFNKFLFLDNKIKPESADDEDSEFADIILELESEEPDLETFDSDFLEEHYDENYSRFSRVLHNGLSRVACRFDVKVFILPQLSGDPKTLDYIRNSGQTILIITNHYIIDIFEYPGKNVCTFHLCRDGWENFSLIDPDCMFCYLIDTHPIDHEIWERIFNMHLVDRVKIMEIVSATPSHTVVDENGNLKTICKYSTLEEKLSLLSSEETIEEPESDQFEISNENECNNFEEDLKNQGYDPVFIESIKENRKSIPSETIEEFYEKVLKKLKNNNILKKTLVNNMSDKIKEIVENLSDVNQSIKIFEVAEVFSAGPPTKSDRKNKSMKDNHLRAEIESLAPDCLDKILSGRLSVSESTKKEFFKHCRAMEMYADHDKKDKDKKLFLINLSKLIINDAIFENDSDKNCDIIFKELMSTITNFVVEDEEEPVGDFRNIFKKQPRLGKLYYDF